jgi:Flp pilus assembly protein TadG
MKRLAALRCRTDRISAPTGGDPVGFFKRLRSDRGQGVVEFAMILPFLGLVVIVCILFGKALYTFIQVTHAANEGARLAAVNQPGSSLSTFLANEFALPGGASVAICYPTGSRAVGEPVQIDVYTDASWVPVINMGQIKAAATMRIEQDTSGNAQLNATTTFNSGSGLCNT